MNKSRFSEEQIVGMLKQGEAGMATGDLCRHHGISHTTFYNSKAKYGRLEVSEAQLVQLRKYLRSELNLSLINFQRRRCCERLVANFALQDIVQVGQLLFTAAATAF